MPAPKRNIVTQTVREWERQSTVVVVKPAESAETSGCFKVDEVRLSCHRNRHLVASRLRVTRHQSKKEKRSMSRHNRQTPSVQLIKAIVADIAPGIRRRASATTQTQTEPVPTWNEPMKKRTRRIPAPVLFLIGGAIAIIMIILGTQALNAVNDAVNHWHYGDNYISDLDTNIGHWGGTSHFLSFYQNDTVVIVELKPDYSQGYSYVMKVSAPGDHHAVTLVPQEIDGRQDLVIFVDGNQMAILYNTGQSMSFTLPQ